MRASGVRYIQPIWRLFAVPNIFWYALKLLGTWSRYRLAQVDLTDDSGNYLFVGGRARRACLLWFGVGGRPCRGQARPAADGLVCSPSSLPFSCWGAYTLFYGLAFQFVPGIDLFSAAPPDASFFVRA